MKQTKQSFFDQYLPNANHFDYLWAIAHPNKLREEIEGGLSPEDHRKLDYIIDTIIDEITLFATWQIHGIICDCDDRNCSYPEEIRSWLVDGDYDIRPYTLEELVDEWNEYTGEN